jgi:hypothetical protein
MTLALALLLLLLYVLSVYLNLGAEGEKVEDSNGEIKWK